MEEAKPIKIKGTPQVPIKKSKKLKSIDGKEVMYFIETAYAYSKKLNHLVDFTRKHPQFSDYHLMKIPIKRI
jgi:hypothetical protein